jgi:hypothetical protein
MTSILDQFRRAQSGFTPRMPRDIFALRLAQKLNDASAAAHYVMLAAEHSEARLLTAYRRTVRESSNGDLGRRFHRELQRTGEPGSDDRWARLLAIRVERRAVAAAVFHGEHLDYTQVRQLSSSKEKAIASAVGFVNWLLASFAIESAALEAIPNGDEIQRQILSDAVHQILRERILPIWQIPKAQLFEACGHPPLRSRKELRNVITTIWPVLAGSNGKSFIQDAAALGLYVQTERLFIIN